MLKIAQLELEPFEETYPLTVSDLTSSARCRLRGNSASQAVEPFVAERSAN